MSLDNFVRSALPPVEVSDRRLDRLSHAVLARLDRPAPWRRLVDWLPSPVGRYALPMATAAMLGLMVGRHLAPPEPLFPAQSLLASSSTVLAGF